MTFPCARTFRTIIGRAECSQKTAALSLEIPSVMPISARREGFTSNLSGRYKPSCLKTPQDCDYLQSRLNKLVLKLTMGSTSFTRTSTRRSSLMKAPAIFFLASIKVFCAFTQLSAGAGSAKCTTRRAPAIWPRLWTRPKGVNDPNWLEVFEFSGNGHF